MPNPFELFVVRIIQSFMFKKHPVNQPCPCQSGRKFKGCCKPILSGQTASSPEGLMRSRYAAYAMGQVDHILRTTHPLGPQFQSNDSAWRREVEYFCQVHRFVSLEVHDHSVQGTVGRVHFTAQLQHGENRVILEERSLFYRVHDRWLYWGKE